MAKQKQIKQEIKVRTLKEAGYYRDTSNNVYYFEAGTDIEQYIESKNLISISYEKAIELTEPSINEKIELAKYQVDLKSRPTNETYITYKDNMFHNSRQSVSIYQNLLLLNKKDYDIITKDNKIIKLTKSELKELILLIIEDYYNKSIQRRQTKDNLLKIKSKDALDSYLNDLNIKV